MDRVRKHPATFSPCLGTSWFDRPHKEANELTEVTF